MARRRYKRQESSGQGDGLVLLAAGAATMLTDLVAGVSYLGSFQQWERFAMGVSADALLAVYLAGVMLTLQRSRWAALALTLLLTAGVCAASWTKVWFLGQAARFSDLTLLREMFHFLPLPFALLAVAVGLAAIGLLLWQFRRPRGRETVGLVPPAALVVCYALGISPFPVFNDSEWGNPPYAKLGQLGALAYSEFLDVARRARWRDVTVALRPLDGLSEARLPPLERSVHLLLLESFQDPQVATGRSADPLDPRLREWIRQSGGLSVPPVFGGRSAESEFELLCGTTADLDGGITAYWSISAPVRCLPRLWSEAGGLSLGSSPIPRWQFNIDKVWRYLGFEHHYHAEQYPAGQFWGSVLYADRQYAQELAWLPPPDDRRPLLRYSFTIDGHLPYEVGDRPGMGFRDGTAEGEWSEVMAHVSRAVADQVDAILARDPGAVIVITGDHAPPIAGNALGQRTAGLFHRMAVPVVLLVDGKVVRLPRAVAHFELPYLALDAATSGAFCRQNRCPDLTGDLIRPLLDGVLVVSRDGQREALCPQAGEAACGDAERRGLAFQVTSAHMIGLR